MLNSIAAKSYSKGMQKNLKLKAETHILWQVCTFTWSVHIVNLSTVYNKK